MIADLRRVRSLLRGPIKGWIMTAIVGSAFVAGLDTLGVAAMLPLMQLLSGSEPSEGIAGSIAGVIGTSDMQALILAMAALVGAAFVLKTALTVVFRWWLLGHTTKLEAEASTELMRRYVLSPYAIHRTRNISEIYRNIASAVPQTFGQVVLGLLGMLADLLTLAALAVVLFVVSPLATLFCVVFFFAIGWGSQRALRARHRLIGQEIAQTDLDAWTALMPGLDGFREARITASTEHFVSRFQTAKFRRARANRSLSLVSELPKHVLEIAFIVGICAIAGFLFATNPAEAVAVLGVFAAASLRMLPTLNRAVATVGVIRAGRVGLEILANEVRKLDGEEIHKETRNAPSVSAGDVVLKDVHYQFEDAEDPILRGVSTVIEQGKTTAFVGSSGAGKSTLLDVILGLLAPKSGTVTINGRDIMDDLPAWFGSLGVVPQDIYVLDDTLRTNIAFGSSPDEIDHDRLTEAIELAQLAPLLSSLPDGLETRLGERGVRLSGGQRQRVGIARALYRRPKVLVLDEATSALDNATESKITETIEALSGRMTIILVAHRLSTVSRADKVIFMSRGLIEAEGTFEEVREASPDFAHLVALGKLG
ncbi:ABC transporter ATP-binding protein [Pseudarthrobacter sp. W1I19]|uniref:ABC transporter ATP-binding protein n=1 Tax=Pseudarthrobacter sp. W1I19 TaxID=3042288 RepID=UPI0027D8D40E|nr:ABC transporter ATP-binding protein [Pseudarthrobacter sp. W1I19]